MKTWSKAFFLFLPLVALFAAGGCPRQWDDKDKYGRYVIVFPPDAGFGHTVTVSWPAAGLGGKVNYPGVSALLAEIRISDVELSPDGRVVTFKINSLGARDIAMLWLRLQAVEGADLASEPTVDGNARGERIFVIGPLEAGGTRTVSLVFNPFPDQGYSVYFDVLEVLPRAAFGSDREKPGNFGRQEIYTLPLDTEDPKRDIFQVTKMSPGLNTKPVWSPGGEWIAFEGLTRTQCEDTFPTPPQVYLRHPDGSTGGYGGRLSHDLYHTANAAFNPAGELVAYQGRLRCENDPSDTSIDIYLYDIKTGTQTMWFSGDEPPDPIDFNNGQVYQPEWSPDGNYIVMSARTTGGVLRWFYAPVDPLTGATIPVFDPITGDRKKLPIFIIGNGRQQKMLDGATHNFQVHEWAWGPDSRHVAVRCQDFKLTPSGWAASSGVAIFDFHDLLNAPSLPIIPEFKWVARRAAADFRVNYPGFNREGDQVWFDSTRDWTSNDLQYVTLTNYNPPPDLARTTFLDDVFYNRTPAMWPPALPQYFPLMP